MSNLQYDRRIKMEIKVKYKIDEHILSFKAYEFETMEDVYVEETEETSSVFRLEIEKSTGEMSILVASRDEHYVYEDVSEAFDIQTILAICEAKEKTGELIDITAEFLRSCADELEEE